MVPEIESEEFLNSDQGSIFTCGDYATEEDSCRVLDQTIEKSGLFITWREVCGVSIHPLPQMETKGQYRIDRVLIPSPKLRSAGWSKGPVGLEIKRSSLNIGPCISQMLDYLRCAFLTPQNTRILLDYIFLFPAEKAHGPIASIMAQNHVGTCLLRYSPMVDYHRLEFFLGEQPLIKYYPNTDEIRVTNLSVGNKTGSR